MNKVFPGDEDKLREKNLATVKIYMSMVRPRLDRHRLFTADCPSGLAFSETGGPQYSTLPISFTLLKW
jgi:hypothetical protein